MTIAVMWARFGPYHLARLHAAARFAAADGHEIMGLEIAETDQYGWDVQGGARNGLLRHTLFAEQHYDSLSPGQIQRSVARTLDRLNPSAVAINGWSAPEAQAAIHWCRRNGRGAVLMSETKEDDSPTPRRWWKEMAKGWLVRRCGAALVGGRKQADYLEKLGMARGRVFYGYDVVDNDHFAREAARARSDGVALRARHNLPERYFFACTRFLPRKNVDGLLRAYAAYRENCAAQPWSLVIAGGGEEEQRLRQVEVDLGVPDVHWAGFLQYAQLPVLFGLASAFIHTARSEPWGLVVNEAAASGLPLLVAGPVGARYELVVEGENGLLFDPVSVPDMAHALRDMTAMSDERRLGMGRKSAAIVADWSPARFGEGLFGAVRAAGAI